MEVKTCRACGEDFTPTSPSQICCPPTDADRARVKGQPRSQCARRWMNHQQRGTPLTVGKVGQPFNCAQCDASCVPGENVAHHASKFCGAECKRKWHAAQPENKERDRIKREQSAHPFWPLKFKPDSDIEYRRIIRRDPCSYCGSMAQATDHIVPSAGGGNDDPTNYTGACHSCNSSKQSIPLLTFLAWKRAKDEFEPWREIVAEMCTRTPGVGPQKKSRLETGEGWDSQCVQVSRPYTGAAI